MNDQSLKVKAFFDNLEENLISTKCLILYDKRVPKQKDYQILQVKEIEKDIILSKCKLEMTCLLPIQ